MEFEAVIKAKKQLCCLSRSEGKAKDKGKKKNQAGLCFCRMEKQYNMPYCLLDVVVEKILKKIECKSPDQKLGFLCTPAFFYTLFTAYIGKTCKSGGIAGNSDSSTENSGSIVPTKEYIEKYSESCAEWAKHDISKEIKGKSRILNYLCALESLGDIPFFSALALYQIPMLNYIQENIDNEHLLPYDRSKKPEISGKRAISCWNNKDQNIECPKTGCNGYGEGCENRVVRDDRKRSLWDYRHIRLKFYKKFGLGIEAVVDIDAGKIVCEIRGKAVRQEQCIDQNNSTSVVDDILLSSAHGGVEGSGVGHFISKNCAAANCWLQTWWVDCIPTVIIETTSDIAAGGQLFIPCMNGLSPMSKFICTCQNVDNFSVRLDLDDQPLNNLQTGKSLNGLEGYEIGDEGVDVEDSEEFDTK